LKGWFLTVCLILVSAAVSLAQTKDTVTLKVENQPLSAVMTEISSQTGYHFVVNDVDTSRKITYSATNVTLSVALKGVLGPLGVKWEIFGDNIILSREISPAAPAKELKVTGVVSDASGLPVMGAGVMIEGTNQGTVTDLDGKYEIVVPSASTSLEFSCLGYESQTVQLGGRTVLDLVLNEESVLMEATVVTALGIRRSEKALSYNVQQVNSDEVIANKDANFINSLNGKVAGLVINSSSSGVGGASKVVMRGQKSVSKSSNALYVIDGVPMYTTPRDAGTGFDSRGSSDPVADINPEDIESISVLSGAAAAALYGSEAANGAVVITTRKGAEGKTSLIVSQTTELSQAFVLPRFQNSYGTGDYGSVEGSAVRSWSNLKLNELNNYGYHPAKDYFRTGVTTTETVSLSTGNEKNQTYLSASAVNSNGIVPNNAYNRYNFTGRNTTKFFKDKMTLDLQANYILQDDRNMTNQGVYNNPVVGAYIFPRGNDWADISMYERYDPTRKINTQYWPVGDAGITLQNPYWINYRNLRTNKKERFMFNASLSYKILDWLSATGRVRTDKSINRYEQKFYAGTIGQLSEYSRNGLYSIEKSEDTQFYADALLDADKRIGEWSIHANLGASVSDMKYDALSVGGPIADGIVDPAEATNVPNVFNVFALSQSKTVRKQAGWEEMTQSVFGSAELGFKGAYYLTLTGRNDWPSQLAGPRSGSKSFFYPSVGASVVLSQIIPMPRQIEYAKVRVSWASVGSAFERWVANPLHSWPDKGSAWNTQTSYPVENLQPERTNSWEVGLSARFLYGFSLEATWYNTHTLNQTIYPDISAGSGYSKIAIQSGDILNTGVELSLGYDRSWGDFHWNTNYTLSSNKNKIVSLANGAVNPVTGEKLNIESLDMGGLGNVKFILKEGGSLGDIYSRQDLRRDSNNNIQVDAAGNISTADIKSVEEYKYLGCVFPAANMAWRNDFNYKGINLGFMISARIGGVVYSRTQAMLDWFGVSEDTAIARDNGGVLINGSDVLDANKWFSTIGSGDTVPQYYTYSATNVRLSEASIGYTLPRKWFGNLCDINLSIVGRNLLMIYNKAPFDPESIATTGNYYQGIDYFMLPSTRNVGFNIRVKF